MRAVAIYILVPTSAFTVAPLVARKVERLVGIYVLAVHALDLSEIVAARSMLFAGGWWRVHFTCGSPFILIPTSGVRGPDTLWRVPWTPLFGLHFLFSF